MPRKTNKKAPPRHAKSKKVTDQGLRFQIVVKRITCGNSELPDSIQRYLCGEIEKFLKGFNAGILQKALKKRQKK